MRVVIYTLTYAPVVNGTVKRIQSWQQDADADIIVVTPHPRAIGAMVIPGIELPQSCGNVSFSIPSMAAWCVLERLRPDVVHVVEPDYMFFVFWAWCRWRCVPLVMSRHTDLLGFIPDQPLGVRLLYHAGNLGLTIINKFVDRCWTVSPTFMQTMQTQGMAVHGWFHPPCLHRWLSGYDEVDVRKVRAWWPTGTTLRILSVARFAPEKKLDIVKRVQLPAGANWLLVGDGPMRAELLEHTTVSDGFVDWSYLVNVYRAADVVVCTCPTETCGFACLEALAATRDTNTCVVVAGGGGHNDWIQDGSNGRIFTTDVDLELILEHVLDVDVRRRYSEVYTNPSMYTIPPRFVDQLYTK
jgi:glycosyltransferase involved in cell wall biosynthesis